LGGGLRGRNYSDVYLPLHPLTEGDIFKLLETENRFFTLYKLYELVKRSVTLCL
jgi:hypothetical protein